MSAGHSPRRRYLPALLIILATLAAMAGWGAREFVAQSGPPPPHAAVAQAAIDPRPALTAVTALGRLEPKDHVRRVAGPSNPSVVIARLYVDEGQRVEQGQIIAELDDHQLHEASVARLRAWLEHARNEYGRNDRLYQNKVVSESERDNWQMQVQMAEADLRRAAAELELAAVRTPLSGQVLKIHARAGERVGPDGIAEIGQTDQMYAIAEVYETDIGRVKVGQRATVTSPALAAPLHGTVDKIGMKVGKNDVLNVDPVAKADARVVEVEVRLDESDRAASLTNLQVDVAIVP